MAPDPPAATEPPDGPQSCAPASPHATEDTSLAAAYADVSAALDSEHEPDVVDEASVELLLQGSLDGVRISGGKLRARHTTPPPVSPPHILLGQKGSPPKRTMAAEHDAFCKDDPVHKAADHENKLLAEIDPVTVEISAEEFKDLLPGKDMDKKLAARVKDFETIDFSQLDSKAEDVRYDPLVRISANSCR